MITTQPPQLTITDLENLNSNAPYYQLQNTSQTIRLQAVQQAAEAVGMQAGLSAESQVIDANLSAHSSQLDQIFDFNLVMYQNNVLPPVIEQDNDTMNINDVGDAVRIGGVTYKIINQVRFVTSPPTWRDYLWMNYPQPQLPNKVLLPTNSQEQAIWQSSVQEGWSEGVQQALSIYKINLNRLVRDLNGMLLYKSLLVQNMVSPYYVSKQDLGVTGDGNSMVIDDQSWQIPDKPQLQLHTKLWHTVLLNNQEDDNGENEEN
jgi:defect-in-organelle-trafficking protein DotC